jgi:hypothetical protein
MKKIVYVFFPISIIFIFIFTRLYNIKDGLFFYNDLGRDANVLYTWIKSGKPPLLGPQTSALPINQSPFYFYWLMVFYLLMKGNPIYSVVSCLFFYILIFIFGLYYFKKEKFLIRLWIGGFFLLAIHPQNIIQGRYVWNPSFVSPLVLLSILSFYQSFKKEKALFLSSFSLAMAIAFSYSIVPLFLVFVLYLLIDHREKIFKFLFYFVLSFILFYLPVLVFEFRHRFLLTSSLLTKKGPPQQFLDFFSKFNSLSYFVVGFNHFLSKIIFLVIFLYSLIRFLYWYRKNNDKKFFYFLFLVINLLTFLIPVSVQAHYIFAMSASFFLIILLERKLIEITILILCLFFYLTPIFKNQYFQKAPRTYEEMNQCFLSFCQNFKKPIYVSVVSSFHHLFHYGPEHRYLLKKNGCFVYNIEENQSQSDLMLVVLDSSDFNKESKYYELDLFGPYEIIKKHYCQKNFGYVLIRKLTKVK